MPQDQNSSLVPKETKTEAEDRLIEQAQLEKIERFLKLAARLGQLYSRLTPIAF